MKLLNFALVSFSTVVITTTAFAKSSVCSSHIPGATPALSCVETDGGPRSVCLYDAGDEVIVQMRGDDQYNGIFEERLEKNLADGSLVLSKTERSLTTYTKTEVIVDADGRGAFTNVYRTLNVFDSANIKSEFAMICK
ncbi:hypothetical protein [Bdellovibrio sp. HCB337]|uniref:hypothetical protein n=1 Tax=Bdellovibrio sp. HCB337 TaxID=3394358 RepID=UPI0039A6B099